jgi:hypothetical protein
MKKKRDYKLFAYLFASFVCGAGSALLYVYARPRKIACMMMLPRGFMQ